MTNNYAPVGPGKLFLKGLFLIGMCSLLWACPATQTATPSPPDLDLKWYSTCGDPVCRPDAVAGVNTCGEKQEGQICSVAGETCDPGGNCGQKLICASEDPKMQPGGCPISLKSSKSDIRYLSSVDKQSLTEDLMAIELANYRYRLSPETQRLGFIIDDLPDQSPLVLPNGKQVDLYGYLSMAVATLQWQEHKIQDLEKRLQSLEANQGK